VFWERGVAANTKRPDVIFKKIPRGQSGNALGPFTIGQVVKLRTRVTNTNGTTTGSVRTLTLLDPNP